MGIEGECKSENPNSVILQAYFELTIKRVIFKCTAPTPPPRIQSEPLSEKQRKFTNYTTTTTPNPQKSMTSNPQF